MATEATIAIARTFRQTHAGGALTARQAKLYSQRLRRDMGRQGLTGFGEGDDIQRYIDEAMILLECALLEGDNNSEGGWQDGVKRAAELLEWLSQPSIKPAGTPLHLLAAAAYQLAGFPAMALGALRRVPDLEPMSAILREFLCANFPETLDRVRDYWRDQLTHETSGLIETESLTTITCEHVVMCIGTVCAYLRTGDGENVERALRKLNSLSESFLFSRDPFSYMLARLTASSASRMVRDCIWPQIDLLKATSSSAAVSALIQFARSAFNNHRTIVWPAQATGISLLGAGTSFVLCTPTGSGKTMVATLGVVQGLYADQLDDPFGLGELAPGNLVLYLVPSRALAAEVENRLAQDLKGLAAEPVVVTGLYGGADWGPTDAWIQTDRAAIVICTFEKADALLRYLGVLFLQRVRLVVLDEVHMVDQDRAHLEGLQDGTSRPFHLEQLGARLLRAQDDYGFRMLALSAVAAHSGPALARWIGGSREVIPATSSYRSTRQMLGRLTLSSGGRYTIHYDLKDGRPLKFEVEGPDDGPYVPAPFPEIPGGINRDLGPEVSLRGPTLWAALHLAAQRPDGSRPSVLISITQSVTDFSATCADLMDSWEGEILLPNYRPAEAVSDELWGQCLASAADYFSTGSTEYRLLMRGIAVHHGKMPALMARRLKMVIDRGYVRVIIGTSTLSEGVNIPVNYLLIPSLFRIQTPFTLQEFTNLIGRAGRPGFASEGSAFVVLPEWTTTRTSWGRSIQIRNRNWDAYEALVKEIEKTTSASASGTTEDMASSPLAHLLRAIKSEWAALSGGNEDGFTTWLEETKVIESSDDVSSAVKYLDTLDSFLLSAITEVEELHNMELPPDRIEEELSRIWSQTYAFAAAREEARLRHIWLTRGCAIKTQYPDAAQRRSIYKTSLSPRSATILLEFSEALRDKLKDGESYALWESDAKFEFVRDVLSLLSHVPSFKISSTLGRKKNFQDWPKLLRWWLAKTSLTAQPEPKDVANWYSFVAQNFIYRGAWGIGSAIGLFLDNMGGSRPIRALEIGDWPLSGLPWIAFWLKELISWGTLDPVAAFLLARGNAIDRPQAETRARAYYVELDSDLDANDALDPRRIRDWVLANATHREVPTSDRDFEINAELTRAAQDYLRGSLHVAPLENEDVLTWIDPAGYPVALSGKPAEWPDRPASFDFELDVASATITGRTYLLHL